MVTVNVTIKRGALARARILAGLSTKELAARTGLSAQTVLNIETSSRMPFPSTIKAIADVLGVDVAEFYVFTDVDDEVAAS